MSKLKFLVPLFFVLLAVNFLACDNEPIDPALTPLLNPTEGCAAPVVFEVGPVIGGSSVNLNWQGADGTSSWQIQYGPQGFAVGSGTQVTATDDQVTITGLSSTVQYQFYIRTVCGSESFSGWAGPVSPGSSVGGCATPVGVTAVRSAGNTEITASWSTATVASWDVQYGTAGFALGSGTTVNTTTPTYTVTGAAATAYDFYVRANCSPTSSSNWVGPINVVAVGGGGPVTYSFLNATVDGVSYTGLRPYFYPIVGSEAILQDLSDDQGRILWIQGNTTPTASPPNGLEFNIRIHENFWQPNGPQTLISNDDVIWPGISINFIDLSNDTPNLVTESELPGTITILEFNSVTKRIRGTFSFSFNKVGDTGTTGPFQVTNGSFDFPVPDEAF